VGTPHGRRRRKEGRGADAGLAVRLHSQDGSGWRCRRQQRARAAGAGWRTGECGRDGHD
jgi:hypothetical protein